jgi:hypothetical protein
LIKYLRILELMHNPLSILIIGNEEELPSLFNNFISKMRLNAVVTQKTSQLRETIDKLSKANEDLKLPISS